ncbi:hypothetical protein BVER_01758c [Candidatus Burkholderia verschuerenii]|uniref:Uncharacterized protein n=1 Tax=Candidatus Burkholderia verschuerenii TaxID=242163 RepID=A0A0L0MHY3_9BURK|nr:hypothetical protein [Candidatus Burkholderia verschuerenii]KND62297.1 hypothetical protein BVER_01758c [Candidatus Burkholderia verschuerenii]
MKERSDAVRMAVQANVFVDDDGRKSVEGYWVVETEDDGSVCGIASGTLHDTREGAEEEMAKLKGENMATNIVVNLPDGYNGHTANFIGEPVQRDGHLVKLRCAGRGREHLIRWIDESDLQAAIAAQIASAKAWEYRDEREGVEFLSLDRLPAEKRGQWTSERPLASVPASLVGLDADVADQPRQSQAMQLIALAGENPQKMRALAELLIVKKGSLLFGRIAASRSSGDALKAIGIQVGGYDDDAESFFVCIEPATLNRDAASASDFDLSGLHVRNSARMGADDYPATVDEIDAEIAWCEYMLSTPKEFPVESVSRIQQIESDLAPHRNGWVGLDRQHIQDLQRERAGLLKAQSAVLKPEDRADLENALFSLRWDRLERHTGGSPAPVTVVASHACYPVECSAKGLLLSGGRVVINYPFKWQDGTDPSFDTDAQIDISHVVLATGNELPQGWRDIGVEDVTRDDYRVLDERRQALELSFAKGEDLPDTIDLHERIIRVMDSSPWMIDNDTGQVADRAALLDAHKPRMRL